LCVGDLCLAGCDAMSLCFPAFRRNLVPSSSRIEASRGMDAPPLRAEVPRFVQTSENARRHGVTSRKKLILIAFVRVLRRHVWKRTRILGIDLCHVSPSRSRGVQSPAPNTELAVFSLRRTSHRGDSSCWYEGIMPHIGQDARLCVRCHCGRGWLHI